MGIRFVLMVNKQGQTRLAQYYEYLTLEERRALEGEIVRKCLARNEQQCSFVEHRTYKIVYRRYASLFFLVGVDNEEVSRAHTFTIMCPVYINCISWFCKSCILYRPTVFHFILFWGRMSLQSWNSYISWLKPWTDILATCVSWT
ncbi:AP-4 complex subunit sigma isoform X1 [Cynara cardunculus var. scolymus]|uniref:AP-4 complex subunit sigma isoform X1 n=1 Tax=Cynara cardunculus var. scolymus TaxID=59895 RepID=UPI000D6267CB|nr:AP-4 complex subunit sigma isoform X1 [Cynara cardunculus var. scolymus]